MLEFLLAFVGFLSPLLIAATGSLAAEFSGRTNMALEGQILIGAFCAALVFQAGGGAVAACAVGVACAGAMAAGLSACMDRFGTDPIMAGLSANLIVQSLSAALAKIVYGSQGTVRISMIGTRGPSGGWTAFLDLALASAVFALLWVFMVQTRPGLRIRAVGSSIEAARTSGIRVGISRASAFALSGAACGLSGVMLVMRLSSWSPGMTFGKGWLALAAMYVGRSGFLGLILSCAAFSLAQTAANLLQGQSSIPQEWSLAFPYLATLFFMALAGSKGRETRK